MNAQTADAILDQLITDTIAIERSPHQHLQEWWQAAQRDDRIAEPRCAALATYDPQTKLPDSRVVYIVPPAADGIRFFTDRSSTKGKQLAAMPQAAITLLWHDAWVQVRMRGSVSETARAEDLAYWNARPLDNRLAGFSSHQSAVLADETERENNYQDAVAAHGDGEVPLPERWGGFHMIPAEIEFWRGSSYRMHRRTRFSWQANGTPSLTSVDGWNREILSP